MRLFVTSACATTADVPIVMALGPHAPIDVHVYPLNGQGMLAGALSQPECSPGAARTELADTVAFKVIPVRLCP